MYSRTAHESRRTLWAWASGGASTGLVLALALFAPARWAAWSMEQASGGRTQLVAPRGTLWSGSAQLMLQGGSGSRDASGLPGRVSWTLRPQWNGVAVQIRADCCTQAPLLLQALPRWGGVHVRVQDAQSSWPAAVLAGLGTPWNTLQPQGTLILSTQALEFDLVQGRLTLSGQAQLLASAISSRLSTLQPMGSYRITVQGGPSTSVQLETLEGGLQLQGTGRWVDTRIHFQGTASAAPEHQEALSNLLNIIGRRDGARSIIQVG
ncbi:MAG: type II secretion system protein N [Betaproteobacteria bacterium]